MAGIQTVKKVFVLLGRLLLSLVFVYAGTSKLLDPQAFSTSIDHYHLLPYPLVLGLALYLPWLEIVTGLAVMLHWRYRGALVLLIALYALFSTALASAWMRGLNIDCGCFGRAMSTSIPMALLRSVSLGILGLSLLLGQQNDGK